jgi:hypothetical protein
VSFFDDDDFDEPTHVADEAPRRASRRPGGFGGFGGGRSNVGSVTRAGGPVDPQIARRRQLVALGVLVVVAILLIFAVSSCVSNGRTSALKAYSRDVTSLLDESHTEVAVPLFKDLSSGAPANTLTQQLNQLRETAATQAKRAEGLSPPGNDSGKSAQHDLELAMNFRAQAVSVIAANIPAAKADADPSAAAANQIAGQMQALVASDVVILQRTKPLIDEALAKAGINGADVQAPRSITDVSWLDPDTVLSKLGGSGATSGGSSTGSVRDRSKETPSTAGSHGNGIVGTSFGDTTLTAGGDNTVAGNAIKVQVANQGGSDESNVDVGATFTPDGGKAVFVKKTVATLPMGETTTVPLTLPASVKSGQTGSLKVQVGGVPGEKVLDNNTVSYDITIGG